jgi:transposase
MLNKYYFEKVYLSKEPCDMRKSIDGLAVLVKEVFKLDLFSSALFVFCNKSRNKLKLLFWQHNGFWLCYRRLETGKFIWPSNKADKIITIGTRELNWLLDGLSIEQEQAHKKVYARTIL